MRRVGPDDDALSELAVLDESANRSIRPTNRFRDAASGFPTALTIIGDRTASPPPVTSLQPAADGRQVHAQPEGLVRTTPTETGMMARPRLACTTESPQRVSPGSIPMTRNPSRFTAAAHHAFP